MLTARKVPRACQTCRLQLLSLFENGFASPIQTNVSRTRYNRTNRFTPRHLPSRCASSTRNFSSTRIRTQEPIPQTSEDVIYTAAEVEAVVRQARQTFGETLPKDYLTTEEYRLYERLYGPPLRETRPEDLEFVPDDEYDVPLDKARNVVLRENSDGEYEEIEFDPELGFSYLEENQENLMFDGGETLVAETDSTPAGIDQELEVASEFAITPDALLPQQTDDVAVLGRNQREIDAITQLRADMEAAALSQPAEAPDETEEDIEEEYVEEEEPEEYAMEDEHYTTSDEKNTHPHTMAGRYGTKPSTVWLPEGAMIAPITELLDRTHTKHIATAAETAFGGKGFPYSTSTPGSKKMLPQRPIGLDAVQHRMTEIEADAYMAAVMPGVYASVMNVVVEIRKRLGPDWIRDMLFRKDVKGPRILDCAGGAGLIAWREVVQAEWDVLKADGHVQAHHPPTGQSTVLTGSHALRRRISRFLDNTTFLPRLPDYVHPRSLRNLDGGAKGASEERKTYDIIIAPHLLFPIKEDHKRKMLVKNLWSLLDPEGGVLVLLEKGLPRGFEAIAGARSLLLGSHIASPGEEAVVDESETPKSNRELEAEKEEGMIIAPCTNHTDCPMVPIPGLSWGRKDYCYFPQRFIRPQFLQKILGAKIRNHEDVKFSYLAVRRGIDTRKTDDRVVQGKEGTDQAFEGYEDHDLPESEMEEGTEKSDVKFHPQSLPRIMLSPLKRKGHVTMDVCTPQGTLERWTVPKSFSKAAYRDARKASWGDLWALGAKTRVARNVRLGRVGGEPARKEKLKGIRNGRMGKGGKKMRPEKLREEQIDMVIGERGFEGFERGGKSSRYLGSDQRRTKGGRIIRPSRPLRDEDLE